MSETTTVLFRATVSYERTVCEIDPRSTFDCFLAGFASLGIQLKSSLVDRTSNQRSKVTLNVSDASARVALFRGHSSGRGAGRRFMAWLTTVVAQPLL